MSKDTMLLLIQRILKFLLFLVRCIMIPVTRLRSLGKRKRLPPIRNKILLLSGTAIAEQIRRKQISSEAAVCAFVERCKEVNPVVNAIVEARFEAAIREARDVDAFLKSTTKSAEELACEMPLLGLPITVKESIAVQGMSHTVGVKKANPERADQDAAVVKMVRKAGAIILLVSNTPELCMSWETCNMVTGTTWNPYDSKRSAGGSSGGEAALLGSGASILSLASDIAGSARLPALYCGVYGHKPTPCWVPHEGHKPDSTDKNWPQFFTIGSMVRYAEDLPLLLKAITQSPEARERLGEKVSLKDVQFYYMDDAGGSAIINSLDGETKTGIHKLKKHIEKELGVKVRKAELSEMKFSFNVAAYLLLRLDDVGTIYCKENNPKEWKSITVELVKFAFSMSQHTFPAVTYGLAKRSVDKLPKSYHNKMIEKRSLLKKQFEELLGKNGVLICPSFTSAACYPYEAHHNVANYSHMMIYNALGLPVTQCPIGLNSKGLPMGVQIVSNPGCDHLTIAVAQEIQRAFGGWQQPTSEKTV